jgi:Ca2+-binding RTX toxin-like protein
MGNGPIGLQWLADDQAIQGQKGNVLQLTQALVGKKISVQATYTDGRGNVNSFTSDKTDSVANVNDAPTGRVIITGAAKEGTVLSATHTLADLDGMGPVSYQWRANGVDIVGATGPSYKLTQSQVGQKVTVTALYTDGFGTLESKTSLSSVAVVSAYSLKASSTSIKEGAVVTFTSGTLAAADYPVGSKISYTLSGVLASDVDGGALTGNAVVDATGRAVFSVKMAGDFATEGTETLTAILLGATAKVTVLDTSMASNSSNWSELANGTELTFDPITERLVVDGGLSAKDFALNTTGTSSVTLTAGGKAVTLKTDVKTLTTSNVVFANSSLLVVGDNSTGATKDDSANAFQGTTGNDQFIGGAGNDTMNGGTGNDAMIGGAGDDTYNVDSSGDFVVEAASGGADTVIATITYVLGANVENLTLGGTAAINATGNALANVLTGNSGNNGLSGLDGNDTLRGGDGKDTLTGGVGSDSMTGGAGADMFVFAAGASGQSTGWDVVTDFTKGAVGAGDLIDFSAALTIGGNSTAATATQASVNLATGVATFLAGSGTTMTDALSKLNARFVAAGDASGEFAFFKVNNSGDYYLYISDGKTALTDVVVQLVGVTAIAGINITGGDLSINS